MYIFIKFIQITLLLFLSLTLAILPWVPSVLIENIVNFTIVGLFMLAGYLVYLIINKLHYAQKKRNIYKSAAYALLFFTYLGLFAIAQIGVSLGKSHYVKTYVFDNITFYTYKLDDEVTEVSIKDIYLPIRSVPIASFASKFIILKKEKIYLYAVGENINLKVYDFKNNSVIKQEKTKEKHD